MLIYTRILLITLKYYINELKYFKFSVLKKVNIYNQIY